MYSTAEKPMLDWIIGYATCQDAHTTKSPHVTNEPPLAFICSAQLGKTTLIPMTTLLGAKIL